MAFFRSLPRSLSLSCRFCYRLLVVDNYDDDDDNFCFSFVCASSSYTAVIFCVFSYIIFIPFSMHFVVVWVNVLKDIHLPDTHCPYAVSLGLYGTTFGPFYILSFRRKGCVPVYIVSVLFEMNSKHDPPFR